MRKFIEQEDWNRNEPEARESASILDPFKAVIDKWIEEDRVRRRKQRHTAKRVYDRLCDEYRHKGFSCSYRTVASYVSVRRKEVYREVRAALPLEHRNMPATAEELERILARFAGSDLALAAVNS